MRIISGRFKGHRLQAFRAPHIRPTTDRVKESIFNRIQDCVEDAVVLDLFSGTGNLAIEAISRGAKECVAVDSHPRSIALIKKNLGAFGLEREIRVIRKDVFQFLAEPTELRFDLVFVDPPFTRQWAHRLLLALRDFRGFADGARILMESTAKEHIEEEYPPLHRLDQKSFGDKLLHIFSWSDE